MASEAQPRRQGRGEAQLRGLQVWSVGSKRKGWGSIEVFAGGRQCCEGWKGWSGGGGGGSSSSSSSGSSSGGSSGGICCFVFNFGSFWSAVALVFGYIYC